MNKYAVGTTFGVVLTLTAIASAAAGAFGLICFQSRVLPGKILVSETEEFLEAVVSEDAEEDD